MKLLNETLKKPYMKPKNPKWNPKETLTHLKKP